MALVVTVTTRIPGQASFGREYIARANFGKLRATLPIGFDTDNESQNVIPSAIVV